MPRKTDSRTRFIATAARLFQEQGYGATGLTQIITESGAPKGSFYFHFPGGKEQLAAEAITMSGELGRAWLRSAAGGCGGDPAAFVRASAAGRARMLEASGFRRGCPVATITLEMAAESEQIREASERALASWAAVAAELLAAAGHEPGRARVLAGHIVSALEGALLLARAQRSAAPLLAAGEMLAELVKA